MPTYTYRVSPELIWFFVVTALTPILMALADLDLDTVIDWRAWLIGAGAASIRAVAAAALAKLGPGGFTSS